MKTFHQKFRKLIFILFSAFMLALTGCAGAHMGMNYGISIGGGAGGNAVQPHFNAGVYAGGRVW